MEGWRNGVFGCYGVCVLDWQDDWHTEHWNTKTPKGSKHFA